MKTKPIFLWAAMLLGCANVFAGPITGNISVTISKTFLTPVCSYSSNSFSANAPIAGGVITYSWSTITSNVTVTPNIGIYADVQVTDPLLDKFTLKVTVTQKIDNDGNGSYSDDVDELNTGNATLVVQCSRPAKPSFTAPASGYVPCGSVATVGLAVVATGGSYVWTVSPWTVQSNNGSNTITVIPNDGISTPVLRVKAVDYSCNNLTSDEATLQIDRTPRVPVITAPPNMVKNGTYTFSTPLVYNPTYTWNSDLPLSTVVSPQGSSTSNIKFPLEGTGNVIVTVTNMCGFATGSRSITITCPPPPTTEFNYCGTVRVLEKFGTDQSWQDIDKNPRFVLDINKDGKADIIGFSNDKTMVSLNDGNGNFAAPTEWHSDFGYNDGWDSQNTMPRFLEDVNNDSLPDIVAFGSNNVNVALNKWPLPGFGTRTTWCPNSFTVNYSFQDKGRNPRFIIDMNKDGYKDIVGFGESNVKVALNTKTGSFATPTNWSQSFVANNGWTSGVYPRFMSDVNGDTIPDIVGFAGTYVKVSICNGSSFAASTNWINDFGTDHGYTDNQTYPRMLADMDHNGYPDIVAFKHTVKVAFNYGNGIFAQPQEWSNGFTEGWSSMIEHPRMIAKINGDAYPDIIGFGNTEVSTQLNDVGTGLRCASNIDGNTVGRYTTSSGWGDYYTKPIMMANIDGDAFDEIVGFGSGGVWVMNCNNGVSFRTAEEQLTENLEETTDFVCYPNPTSGILSVQYSAMKANQKIVVYNSMGAIVKQIDNPEVITEINFENQVTGSYYCVLIENEKIVKRKMVVFQK